jgi:methylthioribose-1-phosphate isomerase
MTEDGARDLTENGDCPAKMGTVPRPGRSGGLSPFSTDELSAFLFRAVEFTGSRLRILDQTLLPHRTKYLYPKSAAEVADIIKRLAVRGAPAIGVAAAYGLAVEAKRLPDANLKRGLAAAAKTLMNSRPTAVNLKWAVVRVMQSASGAGQDRENGDCTGLRPRPIRLAGHSERAKRVEESLRLAQGRPCGRGLSPLSQSKSVLRPPSPVCLRRAVLAEAQRIEAEEVARSLAMAEHGAKLLRKNAVVLTICNTGALAAPGMGTALGVVFRAHLDGKKPHVYACETRPLLQGARLTTLELLRARIPVTLIADSAAASVLDKCDVVLVGADRIAANGDTANKVGTKMLATLARAARKPFYVVAPTSTFDLATPSGEQIVVEERDGEEVRAFAGCRAAPKGVPVFNPAFDVVPARLITGFITDRGILKPPFRSAIRHLLVR